MEILNSYWPIGILSLWFIYKWWNSKKIIAMLPKLKEEGALFIDVRTKGEFSSGNAPGSINIPIQEFSGRLNEIPKNKPVVLCCASGTRSGMARMLLKKHGHANVYNIGIWTKLLT